MLRLANYKISGPKKNDRKFKHQEYKEGEKYKEAANTTAKMVSFEDDNRTAPFAFYEGQIGNDDLVNNSIRGLYEGANPENFVALQMQLNSFLAYFTGAEKVFLMLPTKDHNMMYVRVVNDADVGPVTFSIAGSVLHTFLKGERAGAIKTLNEEHLFLFKRISKTTSIRSIMFVPIYCPSGTLLFAFAVCLINKRCFLKSSDKISVRSNQHVAISEFQEEDEKFVGKVFDSLAPIVMQSISFHRDKIRKEKRLKVTKLCKRITDINKLSHTILEVMEEAKYILCAERFSFFIVDKQNDEVVAKALEGMEALKRPLNLRFSLKQGILKQVVMTGAPIFVNNMCKDRCHYLQYKNGEKYPLKAKNIILFPIKWKNDVFAIGGFSNKIGDSCFSGEDEELCEMVIDVIKKLTMHSLTHFLMS